MEFVVEDPQRTGGITTYNPTEYDYDETTEMWSLRLGDRGEPSESRRSSSETTSDGDVERWIPRERIVYIEGDADGGLTDR